MCNMRLVPASVSGGYKVLVVESGGVLRVCVIVCVRYSRECDTVRVCASVYYDDSIYLNTVEYPSRRHLTSR